MHAHTTDGGNSARAMTRLLSAEPRTDDGDDRAAAFHAHIAECSNATRIESRWSRASTVTDTETSDVATTSTDVRFARRPQTPGAETGGREHTRRLRTFRPRIVLLPAMARTGGAAHRR